MLIVLNKVQGEVRDMAIHKQKPPAGGLAGSLLFFTNILLIILSTGIYIKISYPIRCMALVAPAVLRNCYFTV